ncbi:MAG: hypothetical protein CR979_03095 [Propionibacterium sp.]|nr:MAG: hypothetical protein CR979_03095 [Propionibacterium sp.]
MSGVTGSTVGLEIVGLGVVGEIIVGEAAEGTTLAGCGSFGGTGAQAQTSKINGINTPALYMPTFFHTRKLTREKRCTPRNRNRSLITVSP